MQFFGKKSFWVRETQLLKANLGSQLGPIAQLSEKLLGLCSSTSILQFYIAALPERQSPWFTAYNWDALLLNGDLSHALEVAVVAKVTSSLAHELKVTDMI